VHQLGDRLAVIDQVTALLVERQKGVHHFLHGDTLNSTHVKNMTKKRAAKLTYFLHQKVTSPLHHDSHVK
jgi:hypothetical protein